MQMSASVDICTREVPPGAAAAAAMPMLALKRRIAWKVHCAARGREPEWAQFVMAAGGLEGEPSDAIMQALYDTIDARAGLETDMGAFLTTAETAELASGRWDGVAQ
jgi:hypothetical protein